MSLKLYRIDRSFFGAIGHFFKNPDLPVVAGAIGNPFQVYRDVMAENCFILTDDDEVKRFRDPRGHDLVDDTYYVRHPKKIRTDCLIPARDFHRYVVQEQIADIVSFVRANTAVRKINVSISNAKEAKVEAGGVLDGLNVEGKATVKLLNTHEVLIDCTEPLKPSEKRREFVWMEDFPTTVTAIDNVAGGIVEIHERFDLSFGLSAEIAGMARISTEWLSNYQYNVRCEFA